MTTINISSYDGTMRRIIKEKMAQHVLSLAKMATRAHTRADYLGHCLGGRRPITPEILTKIATALDTTAAQLHRETLAALRKEE